VRIKIPKEKRGLEKDEAGDPDGGRSPEDGKQLTGGDGLDEKEKERAEKNGASKEQTQSGHKKRMLTQPAAHGG
jgi:hypothetical protein